MKFPLVLWRWRWQPHEACFAPTSSRWIGASQLLSVLDAGYCGKHDRVRLSVGHDRVPWKREWTNRDAVWREADSRGPKKPRVLWIMGPGLPTLNGHFREDNGTCRTTKHPWTVGASSFCVRLYATNNTARRGVRQRRCGLSLPSP